MEVASPLKDFYGQPVNTVHSACFFKKINSRPASEFSGISLSKRFPLSQCWRNISWSAILTFRRGEPNRIDTDRETGAER